MWRPCLGAWPEDDGFRFRVWAPAHHHVDAVWTRHGATVSVPLNSADGVHTGWVPALPAGTRYWYRVDRGREMPDPASRSQPEGVHGPSELVDPHAFEWTDSQWRGLALADAVIYELHVGTFTEAGTFSGVVDRLDYLQHLGVTAIELMPIAEFAGRWNWGYDGVALYAPSHQYGRPDDLRRLVNAAHARGLAVILDVVYNHLGPDGAYLSAYSPYYFTDSHATPWGAAVNLHGPYNERVREFFLQNALHWIHEYHLDGLRLDATHALHDDGPEPFLAELTSAVHKATSRSLFVVAEDDRNLSRLGVPQSEGGLGLDGLWADDFHHQIRRAVAGDSEGYFENYRGTTADIAETIERGWFYCGQMARHQGTRRGTDPSQLRLEQFVVCLQNHDQIGNRAFGERLHHQIAPEVFRATTALLLCLPETPLLFMGQEWGASTPFLYFTDHEPQLGQAITQGRRAEFATFAAFSDPGVRASIPDPQDAATFHASRLRWTEAGDCTGQGLLRLHRALLAARRSFAAGRCERHQLRVEAVDDATIAVYRELHGGAAMLLVVRLSGSGWVVLPVETRCRIPQEWTTVLTTEDRGFVSDGQPPVVRTVQGHLEVAFQRPAAILLRGTQNS
jgi:maltooligosyltrehalose trehalohydrolase